MGLSTSMWVLALTCTIVMHSRIVIVIDAILLHANSGAYRNILGTRKFQLIFWLVCKYMLCIPWPCSQNIVRVRNRIALTNFRKCHPRPNRLVHDSRHKHQSLTNCRQWSSSCIQSTSIDQVHLWTDKAQYHLNCLHTQCLKEMKKKKIV